METNYSAFSAASFLNLTIVVLAACATRVVGVQAPPAILNPDFLHCQIPTQVLFKVILPDGAIYLMCWEISNFLAIFLREAPYLTPNLPQIPTFFVLLAIFYENINSD